MPLTTPLCGKIGMIAWHQVRSTQWLCSVYQFIFIDLTWLHYLLEQHVSNHPIHSFIFPKQIRLNQALAWAAASVEQCGDVYSENRWWIMHAKWYETYKSPCVVFKKKMELRQPCEIFGVNMIDWAKTYWWGVGWPKYSRQYRIFWFSTIWCSVLRQGLMMVVCELGNRDRIS